MNSVKNSSKWFSSERRIWWGKHERLTRSATVKIDDYATNYLPADTVSNVVHPEAEYQNVIECDSCQAGEQLAPRS